ncbi:MAG TPA: signal peptidase I [Actinocrinis sp.]|nr:signal peptidase I [Actinocrinis sp.]
MAVDKSDGESGSVANQAVDEPAAGAGPVRNGSGTGIPGQSPDGDSGADTGTGAAAGEPAERSADAGGPGAAAGPGRPTSPAGWALYPFRLVWRFLFPKTPRPFIVELPFLVVFALFLAFLIKTFLVQAFFIPSGSMQNTLAIGDRVLVNRAAVWIGDKPARGQIVVFQDPGGWLDDQPAATSSNWFSSALTWVGVLPQDNGDLIKRVIGVGGDHVVCCNAQDQITVNGVPLNETYLYPGDKSDSSPSGVTANFDVTVPQGDLWVMGDHRSVSEDSRAHVLTDGGFVPVGDVVGRAELIIWPTSQWGTLPVPDTFKQVGLQALGAPGGTPVAALALALPTTVLRRRFRHRRFRRRDAAKNSA